jgi:hypothetical protein
MLSRPPRHRAAAAPPCPISAGMFRPIPSSNRPRAHRRPVAVRAGPPLAPQRPRQARPPARRVPAVQPRLRQLVRLACRTAKLTNNDREATPHWGGFLLTTFHCDRLAGRPRARSGLMHVERRNRGFHANNKPLLSSSLDTFCGRSQGSISGRQSGYLLSAGYWVGPADGRKLPASLDHPHIRILQSCGS